MQSLAEKAVLADACNSGLIGLTGQHQLQQPLCTEQGQWRQLTSANFRAARVCSSRVGRSRSEISGAWVAANDRNAARRL